MRKALLVMLMLGLGAGLLASWPLARDFDRAIPYTMIPVEGYQRAPLMPGDHLQTYYWFWLLSDNLLGDSAFYTNPYEFNTATGPLATGYANFPFSLCYVLFLPLGQTAAYNACLLLGFVLAGLAAWLAAYAFTRDPWAALVAGLIYALAPFRVGHAFSGHLSGFVAFLLPLAVGCLEMAWRRRTWAWSLAAGACAVLLALMEGHLTYLCALTTGSLWLGRMLLGDEPDRAEPAGPATPLSSGLMGAAAGALSLGLFFALAAARQPGAGPWRGETLLELGLTLLFCLAVWLFLAALVARFTRLDYPATRERVGRLGWRLVPLVLYAAQWVVDIPHLGGALLGGCGLWLAWGLGRLVWTKRAPLAGWPPRRWWVVAGGLGLGLAVATANMLRVKMAYFEPSIAHGGRGLDEVRLFSPSAADLFTWGNLDSERYVYLGLTTLVLALAGLGPLLSRRPRRPGTPALLGLLAATATVLCLGPTLQTLPLYGFLYKYMPFFNYPRVPGRLVMVAMVFLAILAAWGLARWRSRLGGRRGGALVVLGLVLIAGEYWTWRPAGLCLLEPDPALYQAMTEATRDGARVLELPIWPGDSHQSAAYEYNVTRTRRPMINGYSPVVARRYVDQVFWPLFPLDLGTLGPEQAAKLAELKVDLVTFHDDSQLYTSKISPFPPRLALRRLLASPALEAMGTHGDVTLFRPRPGVSPDPAAAQVTSPVAALYFAHELKGDIGRPMWDEGASGGAILGHILADRGLDPAGRGNVLTAMPDRDRPGFLAYGPYRALPAGSYRARFRLRGRPAWMGQVLGRVEVATDQGRRVLTRREILGGDLAGDGDWVDIPLDFTLDGSTVLEYRVWYAGVAPLEFNLVVVGFADQDTGPGVVQAEELLRQTGQVAPDPAAADGLAVWGRAGYHPPLYLTHGPYRTAWPGTWRARFRLRGAGPAADPAAPTAVLEVAGDLGKRVFAQRRITAGELPAGGYGEIALEFKLPRRTELGYRVRFLGGADVWVDQITLEQVH